MAYNLLGLRTRVRDGLKDTAFSQTTIDDAINDTILEISNLFHWSFFEKSIEGSLTVGEYTYEQQSDHQLTYALILLDPTDDTVYWNITDRYLEKDQFLKLYPVPASYSNSQPYRWTEYGDQYYFNCPADKAYRLRQYYYKTPTELTDDTDVPELPITFRESIVLGSIARCEETRDNFDFAAIKRNLFNDKISDLISKHAVRTLAAPDIVITGRARSTSPWDK